MCGVALRLRMRSSIAKHPLYREVACLFSRVYDGWVGLGKGEKRYKLTSAQTPFAFFILTLPPASPIPNTKHSLEDQLSI